jgi:uncharacterized repeat protein (TIGR01451 family)
MNKVIRRSLSTILLLALCGCGLLPRGEASLNLAIQTQNGVACFNAAGEVVNYNYIASNTGPVPLAGPAIVTDPPRVVTCPNVDTVGNGDIYLDFNEAITCTSSYTITDSDVNTGSVTNLGTANVGGTNSNQAGVTLTRCAAAIIATPSAALTLTKSANPQTYSQAGQTITYMYVVTNVGNTALGPAQFTITDDKIGAPFPCGPDQTTLAPAQPINCSANYTVTQADVTAANITNTATASGAGLTSAPASTAVTNFTITQTASAILTPTVPVGSANCPLTPGSTCQHRVRFGEWLIQIGRCYGATLSELIAANPQIPDPDIIIEPQIVNVPRIGSAGPIYGPENCVVFHNVQSSDTWTSIQQTYNACLSVLQLANPAGLIVGKSAKVPRNSASLYCPGSTSPGATPNPGFTPTPSATTAVAMRITIDPGQTTASRIGLINPNETIRYLLNAAAGQVLSIKLTAPANEVAMGVNGPTGLVLKPLDGSPTWNSTITAGGDHMITLTTLTGGSSKSYTLEVSLTTPAPTATSTVTLTPNP